MVAEALLTFAAKKRLTGSSPILKAYQELPIPRTEKTQVANSPAEDITVTAMLEIADQPQKNLKGNAEDLDESKGQNDSQERELDVKPISLTSSTNVTQTTWVTIKSVSICR